VSSDCEPAARACRATSEVGIIQAFAGTKRKLYPQPDRTAASLPERPLCRMGAVGVLGRDETVEDADLTRPKLAGAAPRAGGVSRPFPTC
jgi:hypothetical protein